MAQHHWKLLWDRGLRAKEIEARGYYTAYRPEQLAEAGFSLEQARHVPSLVIPSLRPSGQDAPPQMRPDNPRKNDQGKVAKYESPTGCENTIDVPPGVAVEILKVSVPLVITEGPIKADAAVAKGLCCIALKGVWGWRGRNRYGGKTMLPDWEWIALNGRDVLIAFDSDVMTNEKVRGALERLSEALKSRGAKVRYILLPEGGGPDV